MCDVKKITMQILMLHDLSLIVKMKKKILIDANSMVCRTGTTYLSGIGRTSVNLLYALQEIDDLPFDIKILTQTIRGKLAINDCRFKHINIPLPPRESFKWILQNIPILDLTISHDLYHVPHNYAPVYKPSKTVVTIHDAIYFRLPEDSLGHEYARTHYPKLAKACRSIITCSNSSKEDIVKYIGVPPEKVTVIHWGINKEIFYHSSKSKALSGIKNVYNVNNPYFLSVSCSSGRKNTISVLKAFKKALSKNIVHDLLLVWQNPPKEYLNEYSKEIESGRIRFLPHVNDDNLRLLYTAATLSWFPSRYEGFGLPIIESMACGTPVVTCKNSSLSEVGGNVSLYVKPDDTKTMADIMIGFDKGFSDYDKIVKKSLEHSSLFTSKIMAEKYVEFYTNAFR